MFKKLFGSKGNTQERQVVRVPWKPLTSVTDLDAVVAASQSVPQLLFKHSTRCGISKMVLRGFEADYALETGQIDLHFLDLLQHRDVSNAIAERFGIRHESPQVLILKEGQVVAHASHSGINQMDVKSFLG